MINQPTPQQKKFEAATGKDSRSPLGGVTPKDGYEEAKTAKQAEDSKKTKAPGSVNKDVWAEAEASIVSTTGGFAGVSEEGKKNLIQAEYDQMVENDKKLKEWAGDSPILGDI